MSVEWQHWVDRWDRMVVQRALDAHALSASGVTMIGDRGEDVRAARTCGLRSIAVLWGYGTQEELLDTRLDRLVASPPELLAVLGEHDPATLRWSVGEDSGGESMTGS